MESSPRHARSLGFAVTLCFRFPASIPRFKVSDDVRLSAVKVIESVSVNRTFTDVTFGVIEARNETRSNMRGPAHRFEDHSELWKGGTEL